RSGGRFTPAAESNSVVPATAIRPRSGRISPATQLRTVVLPAPEGPTSAVSGASEAKPSAMRRSPVEGPTETSKDMGAPSARTAHQQLGHDQRRDRQHD